MPAAVRSTGADTATPTFVAPPIPAAVAKDLIENVLLDEKQFNGPIPFPSVAYDEPTYNPAGYWRGKAWPHISYWLLEVLAAYGYTKGERGVHRLVRLSPFDAAHRRHMSFALVEVLPQVTMDSPEVQINPSDVKIDVFKSSGAGGQNVQKNATAVRITHIPTGIVVTCQDERSQLKNKAKAMKVLQARLLELETAKQDAERSQERKTQVGTGDRSERIRTYNFPQNRLTDHRVGLTLYKLDYIMEGDLDETIDALVTSFNAERLQEL